MLSVLLVSAVDSTEISDRSSAFAGEKELAVEEWVEVWMLRSSLLDISDADTLVPSEDKL